MRASEPDTIECQFCSAVFETSEENGLAGDQHADHLTDEHQELLDRILGGRVVA